MPENWLVLCSVRRCSKRWCLALYSHQRSRCCLLVFMRLHAHPHGDSWKFQQLHAQQPAKQPASRMNQSHSMIGPSPTSTLGNIILHLGFQHHPSWLVDPPTSRPSSSRSLASPSQLYLMQVCRRPHAELVTR